MMRLKVLRQTTAVSLVCFATACGCAAKNAQAPASESMAPADRLEEAAATGGEEDDRQLVGVEDLVRTNNTFAFDVYRAARTDHFAVSPHGLAGSLALIHAAADGESAKQVAEVLRADIEERDLHARFRQLHDVLRTRATPTNHDAGRGFRLLVGPGIWLSDRVEPSTPFLQIATNQHLATLERFDFAKSSDAAIKAINAHYSDATAGKIDTMFTKIPANTSLLVTSTVQFDAPWTLPFERGLTEDAKFATPDGAKTVPMMHNRVRVGYLDGEGFQLAELPYADGAVSAWVVLPDEGNDGFDQTLTSDYFEWMVTSARQRDVDIRLPRFEITSRQHFAPILKTMGMPDVFEREKADLSRLALTADSKVVVDDVVQVTRIKVDEDGSDAVATMRGSVSVSEGKLPHFDATRPFVFVVRDNPTGAILAVARISKP